MKKSGNTPLSILLWLAPITLTLAACDPQSRRVSNDQGMDIRMAVDQDPGPPTPYIDGGTTGDSAIPVDMTLSGDAANQDASASTDASMTEPDMGLIMPLGECAANQTACMKQNVTEACQCLVGFGGGDNGVYLGGVFGDIHFTDLDDDGDQDAIVWTYPDVGGVFDATPVFHILINQGDETGIGSENGSFYRPAGSSYTPSHIVRTIRVAPVFGERPDIVVMGAGQVSIYRNLGNGVFTPMNMPIGEFNGAYQGPMAIGDLDGDGDQDIVVSTGNPLTERQLVILSQGENGFTELENRPGLWQEGDPAAHVDDGPISIVIADYNQDNRLDIIRLRAGGPIQLDLSAPPGPLDVLINQGDGTFESSPIAERGIGQVIHKGNTFASQFEVDGDMRVCLFGSDVGGVACSVTTHNTKLELRRIFNRVNLLTSTHIFYGQNPLGFRPATSLTAPLALTQPFNAVDVQPLLGGPGGRLNLVSLAALRGFAFSHRMEVPGPNDEFNVPEAGYQITNPNHFDKRLVADFNGDGRDDIALGLPGSTGFKIRILPSLETGASRDGSDFISINRQVVKGLRTIHLARLVDDAPRVSDRPSVAAVIGPPGENNVCPAAPRATELDSVMILRNSSEDELTPFSRMEITRNLMPLCATGYAFGDVDGDNIQDLVATGQTNSESGHRFYILPGDTSNSGFPNRDIGEQIANPTTGHLVEIVKLDEDGNGDALTIEPDGGQAWVYWGPQLGAIGIPFNGLGKIHSITALDILPDPENRLELIIGHTLADSGHWVSIYSYDGNRSFTERHRLPVMAAPAKFSLHDIDFNGLNDLVVSTFCDTQDGSSCGRHGLSVLVANSQGGFTENIHQAIGWANVGYFRNRAELDIIQYTNNDYDAPRILQGSTSER